MQLVCLVSATLQSTLGSLRLLLPSYLQPACTNPLGSFGCLTLLLICLLARCETATSLLAGGGSERAGTNKIASLLGASIAMLAVLQAPCMNQYMLFALLWQRVQKIRVIRIELMLSTWKVDVIPI